MKSYFVDVENVATLGFIDLHNLSKSTTVYYFVSDKCYRPSYTEIESLIKAKCKVEFIHSVLQGANALDFQLSTYIGNLIGRRGESSKHEYIIVSGDKGYDAIVKYWQQFDVNISRIESIQPVVEKEGADIKPELVKAFSKLSTTNRKKIQYNNINCMNDLNLSEQNNLLVLSAICKSNSMDEFIDKITNYPNTQITFEEKNQVFDAIDNIGFENVRV